MQRTVEPSNGDSVIVVLPNATVEVAYNGLVKVTVNGEVREFNVAN